MAIYILFYKLMNIYKLIITIENILKFFSLSTKDFYQIQ